MGEFALRDVGRAGEEVVVQVVPDPGLQERMGVLLKV